MKKPDRETIEKILLYIEEKDMLPGEGVKLLKENGKPSLLGNGGFSFVYEAFSEKDLKKHFALKAASFEENSNALQNFINSIEIQKKLQNACDNVVNIFEHELYEISLDDKGIISGCEYYQKINEAPGTQNISSGNTIILGLILIEKLETVIENDKFSGVRLIREELCKEEKIINLAKDISFSLMKADELNILHRDIKLENIFYDAEKNIYKLGDFGNAKISKETGTIVGTKGYEAPEINNMLTDTYGDEADIYSFGVTIFLLMNGLRFPDSENYQYSKVQYTEGYVFPQCPGFSAALNDLVRNMCAYAPKYRFTDIYKIHEIFENFDVYKEQKERLDRKLSAENENNNQGKSENARGDMAYVPANAGDSTLQAAKNTSDDTLEPDKISSDDTVQKTGSSAYNKEDKPYPHTLVDAIDVMNDPDSTRSEKVLARKIINRENNIQRIEDFIAAVVLSFLSYEGFIPHDKPLPFFYIFFLALLIISIAVFTKKNLKVISLALSGAGTGLFIFDFQIAFGHLAFLHKIYDYHIGIVFVSLFVFLIASYYKRVQYFSKLELKNREDFSDNMGE